MPRLQTSPPSPATVPAQRARVHYGRRWSAALLISLTLHAGAFLLSTRLLHGGSPAGGGMHGAGNDRNGSALEGVVLDFPAATPAASQTAETHPASIQAVLEPEPDADPMTVEIAVLPENQTTPHPQLTDAATGAADASGAAAAGAAGLGLLTGDGGSTTGSGEANGGSGEPIDVDYKELQPHVYAPAATPSVVFKRKISGAVRLRALVGVDGRVQSVEILEAIPNCDECSQESVRAAYKMRFDPIFVDGRPRPFRTTWSYTWTYKSDASGP